MISKPKLTISGYRGIWGKDLNEQITFEFALAFAKIIKNNGGEKILIARDARKSGPSMCLAIKSACEKENIQAEDIGIIPTPSVLLLIKKLSFDGAIIVTASHNTIEYNGLKFVMGTGLFANPEEIKEINETIDSLTEEEKTFVKTNDYLEKDNGKFRQIHIQEILKNINVDLIKNKKFKVVLDPINSAGSIIIPELLRQLDCVVHIINEEQNGEFAHKPEPLVENLNQISDEVLKTNSEIGFVVDPDADRLLIVDEKGKILSEEYTLALAIKNILSQNKSDIVVNLSTSKISEDIANIYDGKTFRAKVGELNVVQKMIEKNVLIGGEGNGGVIYPKINTARDSLVGIALILELMAKENKNISEIINDMPKYIMKKEKMNFNGDLNLLYEKLKNIFKEASVDSQDGIRFDFPDSAWIQVRSSNTEPIIRIYGEALSEDRINDLFKEIKVVL